MSGITCMYRTGPAPSGHPYNALPLPFTGLTPRRGQGGVSPQPPPQGSQGAQPRQRRGVILAVPGRGGAHLASKVGGCTSPNGRGQGGVSPQKLSREAFPVKKATSRSAKRVRRSACANRPASHAMGCPLRKGFTGSRTGGCENSLDTPASLGIPYP